MAPRHLVQQIVLFWIPHFQLTRRLLRKILLKGRAYGTGHSILLRIETFNFFKLNKYEIHRQRFFNNGQQQQGSHSGSYSRPQSMSLSSRKSISGQQLRHSGTDQLQPVSPPSLVDSQLNRLSPKLTLLVCLKHIYWEYFPSGN
ncbi:unnamed protein product [Thelazia callipaeda]|uniref:Uncharacterized protein n=1 Tax=Thelazia callipaeda TaxID=103827 RepID=A0A0N5CYT3_THECL|nr:unnamed protein product [Thelazia callipaeda]